MMSTVQRQKCQMCNSTDLSEAEITYTNGRVEKVPACQQCGHYHFKDTEYAYIVRGVARKWASASDLQGVIEDILRAYMPPGDVEHMSVEVAEMAS
jgi:uncharacterized protein with PIN domain